MSTTTPCLKLSQLRYSAGSARSTPRASDILRGVDITALPGEVTVIIGPNGAGKTTTLNCAQGLIRPTSGTVALLDQDPYYASAELRARVGVMLQEGGLPQSVPPGMLLKHVSRLHEDPWPLEDLVERLELTTFLSTAIRRLSGGQRQRVALAAALIGQPEVVFLDEPSAGLDPQSRHMVYEFIESLRDQGRGIVLTTHLLEEAQRLADTVFILKDGVVVRQGSVAELTEEAEADDAEAAGREPVRKLVFTSPRALTDAELDAAPRRVHRDSSGPNQAGAQWTVEELNNPSDFSQLANWWAQIDLMPSDIRFESRTLEDVFWEVSAS